MLTNLGSLSSPADCISFYFSVLSHMEEIAHLLTSVHVMESSHTDFGHEWII